MVRADQDRNFTFRQAFDVVGEEVRQARRRDDEGPGRRARRQVGGRPRRSAPTSRDEKKLPAADFYRVNTSTGERTLIAKGQLDRRPRLRHLAARHALPLLEGRQGPGLRPRRRARRRRSAPASASSFVDIGRRPPGHEAVLRHRRLHQRRQGGHRQPPLRPVAAAARRLGADEPDRRPRARRARSASGSSGPSRWTRPCRASVGPRGTFDLAKPLDAVGLRRSGRRSPASTSWPAGS
ncbi:MAG: hypothetical protein MZW92_04240 [Comamonadaceae bacterium]|nr:hypothetical protein [Comamonadaceae bacterium]